MPSQKIGNRPNETNMTAQKSIFGALMPIALVIAGCGEQPTDKSKGQSEKPPSVATEKPKEDSRALIYEGFDYAAEDPLEKAVGGRGFSGEWTFGGFNASGATNYVIKGGSLQYPGLLVSGNHLYSDAQSSISGIRRGFKQPLRENGKTKYLSFLVRPEGSLNQGALNGFFTIGFANDSGKEIAFGKPGGDALGDYVAEDRGGNGQVTTGVKAEPGKVALVVVKLQFAENEDSFTLFVNPDIKQAEPSQGISKKGKDYGQFDTLMVYSTGAFSLDEVRIGKTFAEVLPAGP
jgi:hypothetical protein